MKHVGPIALVLAMSGCAHYAPLPLGDSPKVLETPVASILEEHAGAIERPWLKPTKINLSAPLSPDAIAALAVINNPDLVALRTRSGIADAQVFAAGLLPDPAISLSADKVVSGPDTLANLASAIGLDLNALRTRAVTREQAREQARQVRLDLAWAEWQTAGQAKIQAVRIIGLGTIFELSRQSALAAQTQLARTAAAAARGDVPASDAETARIAAFDAKDRARTAALDLANAKLDLARLLGLPPGTNLELAPVALPGTPPSTERLFEIARANRTDLAALRAGYGAQEAAVHKAVLDQFPSLNLTLNVARDSTGNLQVGPAVDFTLPLWNRNRGGIAVERATRETLRAEYAARLFQTRADIAAANSGIALSRRQLDEAKAGLATLQELAAVSARAAAKGDLSQAAAITAEQQLRDRELIVAQADLAIREQTIALELLSGEPIEGWK